MNKFIAEQCLDGFKEVKENLQKSRDNLNQLKNQIDSELLEISGQLGIMELYLGMMGRDLAE